MRNFINLVENTSTRIEPISSNDVKDILAMCIDTFKGHGMSDDQITGFVNAVTDWKLSVKLVLGDRLIGCYLLSDNGSVTDFEGCDTKEDLSDYRNKRGIQGIALIVLPEFRGQRYGDLLKNYPKTLGYDYIYGMQLKSLNNLPQWLKMRRLVADCGNLWVTLEDL